MRPIVIQPPHPAIAAVDANDIRSKSDAFDKLLKLRGFKKKLNFWSEQEKAFRPGHLADGLSGNPQAYPQLLWIKIGAARHDFFGEGIAATARGV